MEIIDMIVRGAWWSSLAMLVGVGGYVLISIAYQNYRDAKRDGRA